MSFESKEDKVGEMLSRENYGQKQVFLNKNRSWENDS